MSLVAGLTAEFKQEYQGQLDRNELRLSNYGALDLVRDQNTGLNSILTASDRETIRKSFGSAVRIPVLDAEEVTIRNVRSCTIPASENNLSWITLTFVTYAFGFTMMPSQHVNNTISYQQDYNRKLMKYLVKFADVLDQAAVNKINTDRNIYFPAAMSAYYPVVGNALQVSAAQAEDFYNDVDTILATADFGGRTNVLASTSMQSLVNRLTKQGGTADGDRAYQFVDKDFYFSNRVPVNAGMRSTAYIMNDGVIAMENRNDPDAIAGSKAVNGKEWGTEMMPIVNLEMGTFFMSDCADLSAVHAGTTGLTRSLLEGFEFSTDVCFVTTYNSAPATRYSPIIKAEISAT